MTLFGHRPKPTRFVVHHVQPKVAGGSSTAANQVIVCDNCHVTLHRIMWLLKTGVAAKDLPGTKTQIKWGLKGWRAAVAAGLSQKIPNEG